jgi:hypothetical protein
MTAVLEINLSPQQKDRRRAAGKILERIFAGLLSGCTCALVSLLRTVVGGFLHLVTSSRFEPIAESNRD